VKLFIILIIFLIWSRTVFAESVSLRWDAPTTNTDDTPLTDLAGFNIYQGTETGVYGSPVDVGNILCYIVNGLTAGITYYFAATAYDVTANASNYSNEVSKLITSGGVGNCNRQHNFRNITTRILNSRNLVIHSQVQ